jgi:hypothetical protein
MGKENMYKFKWGFTWNFVKLEKWMSDLSKKGIHVSKPGFFWNKVTRDPSKQYIYRMDFQPDAFGKEKLTEYISLFADGEWEYIGSVGPLWHYFRKNSLSNEPFELYTDHYSQLSFYRSFRKGLLIAALLNIFIIAINFSLFFSNSALWSMVMPIFMPIISIQILLILFVVYGYVKLGQKIKLLG